MTLRYRFKRFANQHADVISSPLVRSLTVREMVALSGAHTVGKSYSGSTTAPGTWDDTPHVFDNNYFKRVVAAARDGVASYPTTKRIHIISEVAGALERAVEHYWAAQPYAACAGVQPSSPNEDQCGTIHDCDLTARAEANNPDSPVNMSGVTFPGERFCQYPPFKLDASAHSLLLVLRLPLVSDCSACRARMRSLILNGVMRRRCATLP